MIAVRRIALYVAAAVAVSTTLVGVFLPATATVGEGGSFVPLTPVLLADTRAGTGVPAGAVSAGQVRTIQVLGKAGVPTTNVSAIALDLSAESSSNTIISVYPSNGERTYGNLSASATEERAANTAIVPIDGSGKIKVHNSAGSTHFNVGIQGYFTETTTDDSTGGFVAIEPQRVVRSDTNVGVSTSPLHGGTVYTAKIGGVGEIPSDATAVYANVRVRDVSGASTSNRGGLRMGPSNASVTTSSTSVLDYASGPDADSGLAIKLGPDGKIKLLLTPTTKADLIIDVQGYFTAGTDGAAFTPQNNDRVWDSRRSTAGALAAGETREISVAGVSGIPQYDAGAVALHVSAIDYTGTGSLAVYNPDNDNGANGTSNVAFEAAHDSTSRQSTAIVALSVDGTIAIKNRATTGKTHVLLNTQGWFSVLDQGYEEDITEDGFTDETPDYSSDVLAINTDPGVTPIDLALPVPPDSALVSNGQEVALHQGQEELGRYEIVAIDAAGERIETTHEVRENFIAVRFLPGSYTFPTSLTAFYTPATANDEENVNDYVEEVQAEPLTEAPPGVDPSTDGGPIPTEPDQEIDQPGDGFTTFAHGYTTVRTPSRYHRLRANKSAPRTLRDYCSYSPDKWVSAPFYGPCANHDLCIWDNRRRAVSSYRYGCDSRFHQQLKNNCKATYSRWNPMRYNCLNATYRYRSAVTSRTLYLHARS